MIFHLTSPGKFVLGEKMFCLTSTAEMLTTKNQNKRAF